MDYQLYCTGPHTAAKMWGKFQRPIGHVCDPSAGPGDIFRYAEEAFEGLEDSQLPWLAERLDEDCAGSPWRRELRAHLRRKFCTLRNRYAVEVDIRHHAALRAAGLTILGLDFLDVQSLAHISQVIMNPPFNQGVQHVLHAWDVVYDAEIVAIINAESIRNPFSQERQRLVNLIEAHGSVEFLQDEFTDHVDRKTTVEVALIYLEKLPASTVDWTAIMANLKVGDNFKGAEIDTEVCTALALPGNFIKDTHHRFRIAVEAARKAAEAAAIAAHTKADLGVSLEMMQAKGVDNQHRDPTRPIRDAANENFLPSYVELKRIAWAQIIRSTLLTNKLSNQAQKRVEAEAETMYSMEFSIANIHGFLAGVLHSMGDIYRNMVCDLFDTIIGRSNENLVFYRSWKSNEKHRVGMRIRRSRFIIPHMEADTKRGFAYSSEQLLADIDKVFGYLHGISGPYAGLVDASQKHHVASAERIESEFFDFRFYEGTGTLHVYPRSAAVIEKINRFVGRERQWLPGDMNEANADFHTQYEKAEAFSKPYTARQSKSRLSYALQRVQEGDCSSEYVSQVRTLEAAIDEELASRGLHIGPALTAPSTSASLPARLPMADQKALDLIEQ